MLEEVLVGERANPAQDRPGESAPDQRQVVLGEYPRHELVVTRRSGVLDRLCRQPLRQQPPGGALMDLCRRARLLRLESGNGELGEQRVDTEPASSLQPADEQVGALEPGQHGRRIGALQHGVAELGGESAQNRRPLQERASLVVERRQHLLAQVLGHEALVPSESGYGPARVVDVPKPEPCEDERGGPALSVLDKQFDLLRPEPDPPSLDEQFVRLRGGECQLVRAQFHECVSSTQPRQPERGIRPRDDDQARSRRQMPEREVDRGKTLPIRRRLKVVEHESQPGAVRGDRIHQLVDGMFDGAPRHAQALQRTPPKPLPDPIDGSRDVRPQPNRIVVTLIDRDPREGVLPALAPGAHRGRLAVARRRRDERQRCALAGIERLQDTRPLDLVTTRPWGLELGLDQWREVACFPTVTPTLR